MRCSRLPSGLRRITCQSPSGSRDASITNVRSVGSTGSRGVDGIDMMTQAARGVLVEKIIALQPFGDSPALIDAARQLAEKGPWPGPGRSVRPPPSPRQNGTIAGCPSAGADEHAIGLDAVDAPGVGAEQEHVADAALVDELLIDLADANVGACVNRVLPGVGNGAAVGQGESAGCRAGRASDWRRGPSSHAAEGLRGFQLSASGGC